MSSWMLAAAIPLVAGLRADEPTITVPVVASTAANEFYPQVTCTSTQAIVNADILQIATDTRDQLGSLLELGGTWRFPVHIVVAMPDDPLAAKIHREGVAVTVADSTMNIEAVVPVNDQSIRSFVQRQFVTALVWEKIFANTKTFNTQTRLDVVPTWLIEGLNAFLTDDPEHNRESIVRRASLAHRAPTLAEITGWQEISDDYLLGMYQRAFCYYLVNSLLHSETKRDEFQNWLATFAKSGPVAAQRFLPSEEGWQQQLLAAPGRSHEMIYTWEESENALSAAEAISVTEEKPEDSRICTLETVASLKPDEAVTATLQKKIFDLTAMELRAHPSWRPILALYRFGLVAVLANNPQKAAQLIKEAQDRRTAEVGYHDKLVDYVNWFEVTKDYGGNRSPFEPYFSAAHQIEQTQGDPDDPNPIRADLLQVESQF